MPKNCSGAIPAPLKAGTIALLATLICLPFTHSHLRAQDQPVVISNVKVEPDPFSPNDDGVNETAKFSLTLSEASLVTIEIVWFSNPVVVDGDTLNKSELLDTLNLGDSDVPFASDTIYLNSNAVAGLNEFVWDGKLPESWLTDNVWRGGPDTLQMPDSTWTYLVRAEDLDGDDQYTTPPITGNIRIDSSPPVISQVSITPNPFSPDGDGINDEATITFTLTGLPQNTKVGDIAFEIIYDIEGDPVDMVLDATNSRAEFSSDDTLFFNDPLKFDPIITDPIRLQFVPRSLNLQDITFLIQGGRILDSGDIVAVSTSVTILAYDPDNAVSRVVTSNEKFSFVSKVLNVNGSENDNTSNLVEVRTSAGNAIVEVYNNSTNERVASTLNWDPPFGGNGEYSSVFSQILPDGIYRFEITAVDESGNIAWVSRQATAISEPISINDLEINPLKISPVNQDNEYDFTTISYTLSRPGIVTLQIFRDNGGQGTNTLVNTLLDGVSKQDEPHTETWEGTDDDGNFLSQGTEQDYEIVISAYDPITTKTSEARQSMAIDNLPPEVLVVSPLARRTNQANLVVRGRADAGTLVELYRNGELADTADLTDLGTFTTSIALGGDGLKRIYAHAYDEVLNGPTVSDTQTVLLDTRPPVVADTVLRSGGDRNSLEGQVLTEFGPDDTLEVVFSDPGTNVSGIELPVTAMLVSLPNGDEANGAVSLAYPDTARFVPLQTYSDSGTYTLSVTFTDSLGNADSLSAVFSVGSPQPAPSLDSLTVNFPRGGFINSRLDLSQPGDQWVFSAHITDHSGTGLDSASSSVQMINRTTQESIEGVWRIVNGNIEFTVTQNIATDGSMDGWFVLLLIVNDSDPATATLLAADSLLNDTRMPDVLAIEMDSVRVSVTLRDFAPGSGISLVNSRITQVRIPAGVPLPQGEMSNDGDSTLFVEIYPPLTQTGRYEIDFTAVDRAGNQRSITLPYAFGDVQIKPAVVLSSPPLGSAVRTQTLTQPLRLWMLLQDNSLRGIDWNATAAAMLAPDSSSLAGTLTHREDSLIVTLEDLLSNSGQDDGRYSLVLHAVDRAGGVLDTTTGFVLDNLAPDTAGVEFVGDSSTIRVGLADRPAVSGVDSSGVQILTATALLLDPFGAQIATTTAHDGSNTLIVSVTDGKPSTAGTYTLGVAVSDRAGNQAAKSIRFPLNVTGLLTVYPPDSSVVSGPLSSLAIWADGLPEGQSAGPSSTVQVTRNGVLAGGSGSTTGDSLLFTFSDTLATDGSDDGLYVVSAYYDAAALGPESNVSTIFTFDNLAPDTLGVTVDPGSSGTQVTIQLTDGGSYPQVAGIDQSATSAVIIDPSGGEHSPLSRRWLDQNTVEFSLAPFSQGGLHRLRLTAADYAGLTSLFSIQVVNNQGVGSGASSAFVEEVPARTSANISFVSGRANATITRAVLRIFNLRGDLVRRIDVTDRIDANGSTVNAEWLLANDGGEYVNNGVFIYYWEITFSDGHTERIRKTLAVARR